MNASFMFTSKVSSFSERHKKSFHLGYSLMDTGVGSFIFMAGIVSPEARHGKMPDSKIKVICLWYTLHS